MTKEIRDPDCIFCKIAAGEMGTKFVYENDYVVAFDDISPQAAVHTLVIPKLHVESLNDEISKTLLGEVLAAVPEVARIKGIAEDGYRIIQNNGKHAGQTVFHLHIHVFGGEQFTEKMI